jgi:hypothetical protein
MWQHCNNISCREDRTELDEDGINQQIDMLNIGNDVLRFTIILRLLFSLFWDRDHSFEGILTWMRGGWVWWVLWILLGVAFMRLCFILINDYEYFVDLLIREGEGNMLCLLQWNLLYYFPREKQIHSGRQSCTLLPWCTNNYLNPYYLKNFAIFVTAGT